MDVSLGELFVGLFLLFYFGYLLGRDDTERKRHQNAWVEDQKAQIRRYRLVRDRLEAEEDRIYVYPT